MHCIAILSYLTNPVVGGQKGRRGPHGAGAHVLIVLRLAAAGAARPAPSHYPPVAEIKRTIKCTL